MAVFVTRTIPAINSANRPAILTYIYMSDCDIRRGTHENSNFPRSTVHFENIAYKNKCKCPTTPHLLQYFMIHYFSLVAGEILSYGRRDETCAQRWVVDCGNNKKRKYCGRQWPAIYNFAIKSAFVTWRADSTFGTIVIGTTKRVRAYIYNVKTVFRERESQDLENTDVKKINFTDLSWELLCRDYILSVAVRVS